MKTIGNSNSNPILDIVLLALIGCMLLLGITVLITLTASAVNGQTATGITVYPTLSEAEQGNEFYSDTVEMKDWTEARVEELSREYILLIEEECEDGHTHSLQSLCHWCATEVRLYDAICGVVFDSKPGEVGMKDFRQAATIIGNYVGIQYNRGSRDNQRILHAAGDCTTPTPSTMTPEDEDTVEMYGGDTITFIATGGDTLAIGDTMVTISSFSCEVVIPDTTWRGFVRYTEPGVRVVEIAAYTIDGEDVESTDTLCVDSIFTPSFSGLGLPVTGIEDAGCGCGEYPTIKEMQDSIKRFVLLIKESKFTVGWTPEAKKQRMEWNRQIDTLERKVWYALKEWRRGDWDRTNISPHKARMILGHGIDGKKTRLALIRKYGQCVPYLGEDPHLYKVYWSSATAWDCPCGKDSYLLHNLSYTKAALKRVPRGGQDSRGLNTPFIDFGAEGGCGKDLSEGSVD